MFCIRILAVQRAAVVDNILIEIVKERTVFLNNTHNMKGRVKLSNMGVGVVRYKEDDNGDRGVAEEEGGGIVWL